MNLKNFKLSSKLKRLTTINKMTKTYDAVAFIGRFNPPHNAHLEIIKRAFAFSDKVIIIVGSAEKPRTYKNPFFEYERKKMIEDALNKLNIDFHIFYSIDYIYDNQKWANEIKEQIKTVTKESDRIALIGHRKDESSFYLDLFPEYELIEQPLIQNLNSKDIRELYFKESPNLNFISGVVPENVLGFLKFFLEEAPENFQRLVRERNYEENYKKPFSLLPYSPTFLTVDAVVFSGDHVLLIERYKEPGKGLLALPGGFFDADTDVSLEAAMYRELKEETGLDLSEHIWLFAETFDAIGRSSRGRVVSMAYVFDLPNMPEVKASSDAITASWHPISNLRRRYFFEDHFEIISICGGR